MQLELSPRLFDWLGDHAFNIYSQYGEDGVIRAIFDKLGEGERWCVEIGAADGMLFSNTRRLIEQGWRSLQIEADDEAFGRLKRRYENNFNVLTYHRRVDLQNGPTLEDVFVEAQIPMDFDLLIIDVDGPDYHFLNSLWRYRPRVIVVEYNPAPADDMQIPSLDDATWVTQAGWQPLSLVANARGYIPVARTYTNMICIRQDLVVPLVDPAIIAEEMRKQYNAADE